MTTQDLIRFAKAQEEKLNILSKEILKQDDLPFFTYYNTEAITYAFKTLRLSLETYNNFKPF